MNLMSVWNEKEKRSMFFKCIVVLVYPFLMCCLYCAIRGTSLFELYLPNSYNNDVLFYYKQVEGILSEGIPKGYFGYNESSALYGSFATWNPLLFLPWVIWGLIFGWNYMSVLICNITIFSLALVVFVLLTKMEWKNIAMLILMLSLFPSFSIHLLQGLPETIVASVLIIYFGFSIKAEREELKIGYIVSMFVTSSFLTICRPFMIVLVILPCIYLVKLRGKKAMLISTLIFVFNCVAYFVCNKMFASEYISPLMKTEVLEILLTGNISWAFWSVVPYIKELLSFMSEAFTTGLTAGTQYVIVLLTAAILFVLYSIKGKNNNKASNIMFAITVICIVGATLVIGQKINEGGRHVYAFSIVGILLCSANKWSVKTVACNAAITCALIVFIMNGAMVPTDYDIPKPDAQLQADIEYWEEVFEDKAIKTTDKLSWDNTVIWPLGVVEQYELFSLPEGMGISCCLHTYIFENVKELKSKYIVVDLDGELHKLCIEEEYLEIGRTEDIVLYQRY